MKTIKKKIAAGLCLCVLFMGFPAHSENVPPEGEWWNGLTSEMQLGYVLGWREGVLHGVIQSAMYYHNDDPVGVASEKDRPFRESMLNGHDLDVNVLRKQISLLYKDPANAYIEFTYIFPLAVQKIQGKSIEAQLKKLRPLSLKTYNDLNKHP